MQNKIDTERYVSLLAASEARLKDILTNTGAALSDNKPVLDKLGEISTITAMTDSYFKMLPNLKTTDRSYQIVESWCEKLTQYVDTLNNELDVIMKNAKDANDEHDFTHTPTNTPRM